MSGATDYPKHLLCGVGFFVLPATLRPHKAKEEELAPCAELVAARQGSLRLDSFGSVGSRDDSTIVTTIQLMLPLP